MEILDTFGAVRIITIEEENIAFLFNGNKLKLYRRPLTKEEFVKNMQEM